MSKTKDTTACNGQNFASYAQISNSLMCENTSISVNLKTRISKCLRTLCVFSILCLLSGGGAREVFAYEGVWTEFPQSTGAEVPQWPYYDTVGKPQLIPLGTDKVLFHALYSYYEQPTLWLYDKTNNEWIWNSGTSNVYEMIVGKLSETKVLLTPSSYNVLNFQIVDIDSMKIITCVADVDIYRNEFSVIGYIEETQQLTVTITDSAGTCKVYALKDSIDDSGNTHIYSEYLDNYSNDLSDVDVSNRPMNAVKISDSTYIMPMIRSKASSKMAYFDVIGNAFHYDATIIGNYPPSDATDFVAVADNTLLGFNGYNTATWQMTNRVDKKCILHFDNVNKTVNIELCDSLHFPENFIAMTKLGDGTLLYLAASSPDSTKIGNNTLQATSNITVGNLVVHTSIGEPVTTLPVRYLGNNVYETDYLQNAELYDILGNYVGKYTNVSQIDLSKFITGVYFLKANNLSTNLFKY
jgi:hypothetical protein